MTAGSPAILCPAARALRAMVDAEPGLLRATARERLGVSFPRLEALLPRAGVVAQLGRLYVEPPPVRPPRSIKVAVTAAPAVSTADPVQAPGSPSIVGGALPAAVGGDSRGRKRSTDPEAARRSRMANLARGAASRAAAGEANRSRALHVLRAAGPVGLSTAEWAEAAGMCRSNITMRILPAVRSLVVTRGRTSNRRHVHVEHAAHSPAHRSTMAERLEFLEARVAELERMVAAMGVRHG